MVRLASLDDIVASKEFASLDKATKRCQSCASYSARFVGAPPTSRSDDGSGVLRLCDSCGSGGGLRGPSTGGVVDLEAARRR